MADARDRFLDLATLPLAENPEMQIHARVELEERMDPNASQSSLEEVADTLEQHDRSKWSKHWGKMLLALVAVSFALCVAPTLINLNDTRATLATIASFAGPTQEPDEKLLFKASRNLSPDQRLILYGDISKESRSERLEALCTRYPENPRYYADYAISHAAEYKKLPPDFLITASRIDPDNGWFPCFAATVQSWEVVEAVKQSTKEKKARTPKTWTIKDEVRLKECIALLQQGCRLPRFTSYQAERWNEQLALLPPVRDFLEEIRRIAFLGAKVSTLSFRNLANAIAAEAQLCGNEKDQNRLRSLIRDWEILVKHQTRDSTTLVDALVAQYSARAPLLNMIEASSITGLNTEAAVLTELDERLERENDARKNRPDSEVEGLVRKRGSMLENLSIPMVSRQVRLSPVLSEEDLKAGRLTDHTIGGHLYVKLGCVAALFVCGLCALHRYRHGPLLRQVSSRLRDVFRWTDWLWLFAAAAAPCLYYQAIYHLTPLGGKDWSYSHTALITPSFQVAGWITLIVMTPIVIARWRLQKRMDFLELGIPNPRLGRIMLLIAWLVIPLAGILYLPGPLEGNLKWQDPKTWLFPAGICLLVAQLWCLVLAFKALFGKRGRGLGRAMISRLLVPSYLVALLLLSMMHPIYDAQERYWVQRNSLRQMGSSDAIGFNRYEEEVIRTKRAEILEMLTPLERLKDIK